MTPAKLAAPKDPRWEEVPVVGRDLWTLVLCYVRYAMGRRSTAPHTALDFVRMFADKFTPAQREQIKREIETELRLADGGHGGYLGDKCDDDVWREAVRFLGEEGRG